jgi:uncharacterized protein
MYGSYDFPFFIEKDEISLSMDKFEKLWIYKRDLGTKKVEKLVFGEGKHITINPVEPVNTPKDVKSSLLTELEPTNTLKEITPNLLIEFEKTLILAGGARKKIFLTFPIEIGVFILDKGNKNLQLLDVFTFVRQKFTLYGEVTNGMICKRWKSEIYSVPPSPDPLKEGIIELTLKNTTSDWASISKVVFSAFGMRLYYDVNVFMKAHMVVRSKNIAETGFEQQSISAELKDYYPKDQSILKESIEIYNRKLDFVPLSFEMRFGL